METTWLLILVTITSTLVSGAAVVTLIMTQRKLKALKQENIELKALLRQYKEFRELRATPRMRPRHRRDLDAKIIELWSQGYSLRQIAKIVGVSHTTVHRRLRKLLESSELNLLESQRQEEATMET